MLWNKDEYGYASIRDVVAALEEKIVIWNTYPVLRFRIKNGEVHIQVLTSKGKKWAFFGYVQDVLHNLGKGYYNN